MPITVLQLAEHMGAKSAEDGSMSMGEFDRLGLPFLAGCQGCGATLAPYNAYPSKTGYIRCADCVGDCGYETVEEAKKSLFSPESQSESA